MEQINAAGGVTILIHFTYPLVADGSGNEDWRIACMPNMKEFHQTPYHPACFRSNDRRAVTCHACRISGVFKATLGGLR